MAYKDLTNTDRGTKYYSGVAADEFVPRKDLRRLKFGRLTVLDFSHKGGSSGRLYYYKCLCDCGKECIKSSTYLLDSKTCIHKSCGCWHRELNIATSTTHGHGKKTDPTYKAWVEIKLRCCNPRNQAYKNYGGRGIKVCDRWLHSFENFLADMGERPSKEYSIDRIDVNGDYCPKNCRWATRKEQCNNRRSNINITYNCKTQTLMQWCEELGLSYKNARSAIRKRGRSLEYIIENNICKTKNLKQS